jgi:hypothetical protein
VAGVAGARVASAAVVSVMSDSPYREHARRWDRVARRPRYRRRGPLASRMIV